MCSFLFWLVIGLVIGTLAGGVIFVVGMALVYLFLAILNIFDWFNNDWPYG